MWMTANDLQPLKSKSILDFSLVAFLSLKRVARLVRAGSSAPPFADNAYVLVILGD